MVVSGLSFDITQDVLSLGVQGAYFTISGVHNRDTDPVFEMLKERALREVLVGLSEKAIETDGILQGFRDLHSAIGVSNRKNVAAPENLLKNLLKTGTMPHINLLVDIYNLISIQSRLALGAHDVSKITGNVHLRLTRGNERFHPLGSGEVKLAKAGQYAYIDDADDVICMLEVRQVEKTKAEIATTNYFFVVQGNAFTHSQHIRQATEELITLIKAFCGSQARLLYAPWL